MELWKKTFISALILTSSTAPSGVLSVLHKIIPERAYFVPGVESLAGTEKSPLLSDLGAKRGGSRVPPILEKIAYCESGGKQYDKDGNTIRGKVNSNDIGKFQISWDHHSSTIQKLGLNVWEEPGNTEYALYLYETQGLQPWKLSEKCWSERI